MPSLPIHEGTFFSPLDEEAFFSWLSSIPGVRKIVGTPDGLQVSLRSAKLSEAALRDLIALHWRYQLPMRDLRTFMTERNAQWFRDRRAYWFEAVFGEGAVPANIEVRLVELRKDGVSPVQAIKIIRSEYAISLGEAKRRLSLSAAWLEISASSARLQEEAISIASGTNKRSQRIVA